MTTTTSPENLSQDSLSFILAIDNCGCNCEHCPAFLVDLWAFSEQNLIHDDGTPRTFDEWFPPSAQSI